MTGFMFIGAAKHNAVLTHRTGVRRWPVSPRTAQSEQSKTAELPHPQCPPDLAKPWARARQEQTSPEHPARQEKNPERGEGQ